MRVSPGRLRGAVELLARSQRGKTTLALLVQLLDSANVDAERPDRDALMLLLRGLSGQHAEGAKDAMRKVLNQR